MIRQDKCNFCGNPPRLVKSIGSDGSVRIYYYCDNCRKNAIRPAFWISKKQFTNEQIESIPILIDGTIEAEPCAYHGCSKPGQYHHAAPRYIFDNEADKFPGFYLCLEHHRQWHDTVDKHYGKPERKSYD